MTRAVRFTQGPITLTHRTPRPAMPLAMRISRLPPLLLSLLVLGAPASLAHAADRWIHLTAEQGLPGNEIQFVKPDTRGAVWVGTQAGLARLVGDKFEPTAVKGEVWDVLRLDASRYWVGAARGAILVEGEKVNPPAVAGTVTPILPFGDKGLLALAKDPRTEVNALVAFDGAAWGPVAALKGKHAVDLVRLADGKAWVCVEGNGVWVFDPAKGLAQPTRYLEGQNVTAVAQDAQGRVWCGLWQRGVAVFDGKAWTNHLADQSVYALSIRQDKAGLIWVATDKAGLFRFDGKQWANDLKDESPISLLEPTSDGRVWISTQNVGGLRYWDGKAWVVSLPGPTPVRCLLETSDGRLIAGAVLDGLYILPRK